MSDSAVLHRRSSGTTRLLRGWIVALLAVLLAAGGHQAAHSLIHGIAEPIPLQLLGFSAAVTAPVAVALAGKRMSTWATSVTTVFGQLVFHALYSLPHSGAQALHSGQNQHHGQQHLSLLSEPHVSQAAYNTIAADAVMLAAHLLAAALTTFVIVHGQRSLVAIVCWLALVPIRVVLARLPVNPAGPKAVPLTARVWIPHPMNVTQTRSTRGPPVLA